MTTSGSYDYTTTMGTIIVDALSLIGAHDPGEPVPPEMWVYVSRQLNMLMSSLSKQYSLWRTSEIPLTLTPGTPSYVIGPGEEIDSPKPFRIRDARRVSSSGIEIPIDIESRSNYLAIPNKTLQAPPTLIYYSPDVATGTFFVWPTGTTTDNTIKVSVQRPVQDFDAIGNNPDLPKEWELFVIYMLAVIIAPTYLGGEVPKGVQSTAQSLLLGIAKYDEETTSVNFIPKG